MRMFIAGLVVTAFVVSSCEFRVETGKEKTAENDSKIRNRIEVRSQGVEVKQAFLLFEDGTRVPEDNVVQVNQKVVLRLIVSGWKEKEGKVFLTGGETLETNEGEVFLKEDNLFAGYTAGIDAKDAEYISMNVVITRLDRLHDYYKVSFFVKDNKEPGNKVEGSYKLYIK